MKKSVFLFLGASVLGVCALGAQTNTMSPSPAAAPAQSTSTTLTPPPDNAPPPASAMASPTTVQAATPSEPAITTPPVAAAHTEASPAPVTPAVHKAPPKAVAQSAKRRAPHLYHLTHISWIVATRNNLDADDRYVTIVGHVTRRIGDDEYWFSDGTASVRLDSENFDLPIGRRLIVGGRIDQAWLGFGHLEVDVRRWRYAY